FDVTPTADGLVMVKVPAGVAQDSGGKPNLEATFSITSDRTAPPAPVITGLDPASDSGQIGDGRTNDTTPTIDGTAEPGTTIEVFADSGSGPVSLGTVVTAANGTWSFTPTTALVDGTYTITATATDPAGNASPTSAGFNLVINTVRPSATVTTTATDPTNLAQIPFTVTFSEDVTGFSASGLTVTNGTVSNFTMVNAQTYTFDVTPTADGIVFVKVPAGVAQDTAGNANTEADFTITSDRTVPAAPVVNGLTPASDSGTQGDGITNVNMPTIIGTAEAGSSVEVFANSGSG